MLINNSSSEWSAAYAAYAAELEDFVRGRLDDTGEAEDLLQEVWSTYAETEAGQLIEQPRAWLYRVARNRITDVFRRRTNKPAFVDVSETSDELSNTDVDLRDPDELMDTITEALDLLPANQREVFERNELAGETLREIAADLGIPLKTAISRKGYARARLQELLRDTYEDYFSAD